MKTKIASMAFVPLLLASGMASAGVVVGPTSVINNDFGEWNASYSQNNMINQSTLSAGYVSGVTDFDTYAAGNPTANCNNCTPYYFGKGDIGSGNIDFDLGGVYSVDRFGLWNGGYRGIINAELFTSITADFASATSVGVINPTRSGSADLRENLQVFDLIDTNAQFVRLSIYSHATNILGVAGVAFDVNSSSVPEPATLALLGIGLAGIGFSKRKKNA